MVAVMHAVPESWWVSLVDVDAGPICSYWSDDAEACADACYPIVEVAVHQEGGIFVTGGIAEAILNITGNYEQLYRMVQFELDELDGQQASGIVDRLSQVIGYLGTDRYRPDYYAATPGNAGYALEVLRDWALQHPRAIFRVTGQ